MKLKKPILFPLLFCIWIPLQAQTLLAIVNGHKITTDVADKSFSELKDELKDIYIKRLIEKELAIEYALSSKIVQSEKFKKSFDHILKMSQRGINIKAQTLKDAIVSKNSLSKEQLRSKKGLLAFDLLLDAKAKTIDVNTSTLEAYYQKNFLKYNLPKLYEISSIVVEKIEEAEELLTKMNNASLKSKTFHDLAQHYSVAPNKSEGGYLGQYDIESMNPFLAKEIKEMSKGSHSPIIQTEFGYELVYLIDITPAKKQSFKEVKKKVKQDCIKEIVIEWAFNQIEKMKTSANVVYSL